MRRFGPRCYSLELFHDLLLRLQSSYYSLRSALHGNIVPAADKMFCLLIRQTLTKHLPLKSHHTLVTRT